MLYMLLSIHQGVLLQLLQREDGHLVDGRGPLEPRPGTPLHYLKFAVMGVFRIGEGHHLSLLCPPEVLVEEDPPPPYDRGQDPPRHGGHVVAKRLFDVQPGVQATPAALSRHGVLARPRRAWPP